MEVIFGLFVLILSSIGLIQIFKIISFSIFCHRDFNENIIIIIPILGHKEDIEMTLRNAISGVKWARCTVNRQIICLDLGADAETYKICKIFSEEYDWIEVCSLEEFNEMMVQSSV